MNVDQRLRALGLTLPPPARPAGAYSPTVLSGNLLFVSRKFPIENGQLRFVGRIGDELTDEEGCAAARLAALNVLSQLRLALGGFKRLETLLRVDGHVARAPVWHNAPHVLDAASELFNAVLGERGCHARTAFTPPQLPLNLAIELVVVAAVRPRRERLAVGESI